MSAFDDRKIERMRAAKLMADGRERTISDVAIRIGTNRQMARHVLKDLVDMGLLKAERPDSTTLFRSCVEKEKA